MRDMSGNGSLDLNGRTALVTGATSGIGQAIATALLAAGAHVAVVGRRKDRLAQLRSPATAAGKLLVLAGDLRDDAFVAATAERLEEWRGGLDILINAAGLSRSRPFGEAEGSDIRQVMETNLVSLALLTRAVLPLIRDRGDIVNIGSTAVVAPAAGSAVYSATKAGVSAFSQSLRRELLTRDIRVSVIHPGYVETEFLDYVTEPEHRARIDRTLQAMDPLASGDVADVVMFMLGLPQRVSMSELYLRPTRQSA